MNHTIKRTLAMLLTLAMILSLGILPASAEDAEETLVVTEPAAEVDDAAFPRSSAPETVSVQCVCVRRKYCTVPSQSTLVLTGISAFTA